MGVIIYGSTVKQVRQGEAADWCPLCHALRRFSLYRHEKTHDVYFIFRGLPETVGGSAVCATCGYPVYGAETRYRTMNMRGAKDFDALARFTNPSLVPRLPELREYEARIAEGRLSAEERAGVLRETIEAFQRVAYGGAAGRVSQPAILMVVLLAIAAAVLTFLPFALNPKLPEQLVVIPLFVGSGVIVGAFAWFGTRVRRYVRSKGPAMLAQAWRTLNPSVTELKAALADAAQCGFTVARWLDADQLAQAIRPPRRSTPG